MNISEYQDIFSDKLEEIYPDIQDYTDISIKHINSNNMSERLCVFGILDTPNGLSIADEMLSWITSEYDVYCVIQKAPGGLYEYPALRFAQWLADKTEHEFILYVHTKGAFFKNPTQKMIRNLWKHEFTRLRLQDYIKELNNGYDVVCPLTGPDSQTWYNGMIISKNAFSKIKKIVPQKDRYAFQRLFSSLKIKGMLKENVRPDFLKENTIKICQDMGINKIEKRNHDYSAAVEWSRK